MCFFMRIFTWLEQRLKNRWSDASILAKNASNGLLYLYMVMYWWVELASLLLNHLNNPQSNSHLCVLNAQSSCKSKCFFTGFMGSYIIHLHVFHWNRLANENASNIGMVPYKVIYGGNLYKQLCSTSLIYLFTPCFNN